MYNLHKTASITKSEAESAITEWQRALYRHMNENNVASAFVEADLDENITLVVEVENYSITYGLFLKIGSFEASYITRTLNDATFALMEAATIVDSVRVW